ncbi:CobW family GTP-binding protein [Staphylococcus sp. 11261D007BR]
MLNKQITITIINGFLGSGKTTFIRHYMTKILKKDEKVALIVNEFGDFDIDGQLLNQFDVQTSMTQGCICCDLQQDLIGQIHQLTQQGVERIVIEATGVANPIDIIMACQDPVLDDANLVLETIGIVDCMTFLKRHELSLQTAQLMEDQVRASQRIMLNKSDQLDSDNQKQEVINAVEALSPHSEIALTRYGEVQCYIANQQAVKLEEVLSHRSQGHAHYSHMKYTFNNPVNRDDFIQFILKLPDNVLRLKGFVSFREAPDQTILVQYANQLPLFDAIGATDVPLSLVIIGEQLDTAQLRNQLDMLQFS